MSNDGLQRLRAMVAGHSPADSTESEHQRLVVQLIDEHGEFIADRTCRPGHVTGSAAVVNAEGTRLVLLHHTKLDIWVQAGGHADGDLDLAAVALREAEEETGIEGLVIRPTLVDIDVHEVRPPKEDPHLHLDLRFIVDAPVGAELAINHESRAAVWADANEARALNGEPGLARLFGKCLRC